MSIVGLRTADVLHGLIMNKNPLREQRVLLLYNEKKLLSRWFKRVFCRLAIPPHRRFDSPV